MTAIESDGLNNRKQYHIQEFCQIHRLYNRNEKHSNAWNCDVAIPIQNLLKNSDIYLKFSGGRFNQYAKDDPNVIDNHVTEVQQFANVNTGINSDCCY